MLTVVLDARADLVPVDLKGLWIRIPKKRGNRRGAANIPSKVLFV